MKPKNQKLIEYLFLAEFDIDVGSTVRHQYPQPCSLDEQTLAELMLPDGLHKRDEDWTVFFIRPPEPDPKKKKEIVISRDAVEVQIQMMKKDKDKWKNEGKESSMSLDSPQSKIFIQDKKKAFQYTIEYDSDLCCKEIEPTIFQFSSPKDSTLSSWAFKVLPDEDKNATNNSVLSKFEEFINNIEERTADDGYLYCLNRVTNVRDDSIRRGSIVKALAVATPLQSYHIFKPILILALSEYYKNPTLETLKTLYESVNNTISYPTLQFPSQIEKDFYRSTYKQQYYTTNLEYNSNSIPIKIPLSYAPGELADYSLSAMVKKFGYSVMILFNALIYGKRIIFSGRNCCADEICSNVLTTLRMVCPPLSGFSRKTFPYTNLTYLDFMALPGYIIGVANPLFEEKSEWWDVCVNLDQMTITNNPNTFPATLFEKQAIQDTSLFAKVSALVSSTEFEESKICAHFQSYTQHLCDMAFDEAEFEDGNEIRYYYDLNSVRLENWKRSESFQHYSASRKYRYKIATIKDPRVLRHVRKLRVRKNINDSEMIGIYKVILNNLKSELHILEFLSYLPETDGGLYPLAVGLFHSSETVRSSAFKLFQKLENYKAGHAYISELNQFLLLAYNRLKESQKDVPGVSEK